QPLEHILRPTDRFSEFAIADHVDAGLCLPTHHLGYRVAQALGVGALIERAAGLLGTQKILQWLRPDQAADMPGEDAFRAALHLVLSLMGDAGRLLADGSLGSQIAI